MVSNFDFQGGSELVELKRLNVLGGAGIKDLHNGDVVDFFANGEGRHGRVMYLLDSCCGNFLLDYYSAGDSIS